LHSRTIELDEEMDMADGQEVELQIKVASPRQKWGDGILRTAGALVDDSSLGCHDRKDLPTARRSEAMTRVLHGVGHGKTIEATQDLCMWEGQAVEVLVVPAGSLEPRTEGGQPQTGPKKLPGPPPGWKPGIPSQVAGVVADEWTDEDDRILEQIQADRRAAKCRELSE
jgi:hypothetical protein